MRGVGIHDVRVDLLGTNQFLDPDELADEQRLAAVALATTIANGRLMLSAKSGTFICKNNTRMSCCENRHEFLLSIVGKMRNWLHPWVTPQLVAMYDENKIVGVMTAVLLPLHAAGKIQEAVEEVMKQLVGVPDEELAAVRTKVGRYLTYCCEAMI